MALSLEAQKHTLGVAKGAAMGIGIYIRARDIRRWKMAIKRVTRKAEYWVLREMQRRSAIDFSHLVIRNIMNQRYVSTWSARGREYNDRYRQWLVSRGYDMRFWLLRYDLVRSVQVFYFPNKTNPKGRDFMAGIPSGIMDAGGKGWFGEGARRYTRSRPKSIAMYAKILEFGKGPGPGGQHPPRPVFQPTMKEYAESGWITRGKEALNQIGMGWR